MVWDVRFKGMSIGRAEWAVGNSDVLTRFRADKLFGKRTSPHDLRTGQLPGTDGSHTLHSAIGWLRAWAEPAARASSLRVLFDGDAYEVDVATPTVDSTRDGALRVDAQASLRGQVPTLISIWLSRDERRAPLHIEIAEGHMEISAWLVAYEMDAR